ALPVVDIAQRAGEIAGVGVKRVVLRDDLSWRKTIAARLRPEVLEERNLRQVGDADALQIHERGKLRHRLEVGLSGFWIHQVGRHGEIALHQVVARQTADIRALYKPSMA